ncbi:MAG: metallophosphoesterase [Pseudomonadota bacterium]|nr:metallophosphoesterase [Pseudomonadota bacterium]
MSGLTLAHVSDLHLPFEPQLTLRQHLSKRQLSVWSWRRRRAVQSSDILEALKQDLRAQAVDHVLLTGDITNFSLPAEFRQAADWLAELGPAERISLVPGNHDALVPVPFAEGLGLWAAWTRLEEGWPFVHRVGDVALIGLNSALPTAPLLARGRVGPQQLTRLERILAIEGAAGRVRVVMLHHPLAQGAIGWRKALADGEALRAVLQRAGAELVLHGHARDARLDAIPGPHEPIPCLCVPSSSALPNPQDQGARWHGLRLIGSGGDRRVEVTVRRWSMHAQAFVTDGSYELCLPRGAQRASDNGFA